MVVKAIVQGDLRKRQMIRLSVDGHHLVTTWGTAQVTFRQLSLCHKYMLDINRCETFFHVDAIEVHQPGEA